MASGVVAAQEPPPSSARGAALLGEQGGEARGAAARLQAPLGVLLLSIGLFKMKRRYEESAHPTRPPGLPRAPRSSVSQPLRDPKPTNPPMLLAGLHHPHSLPSFPWGQRLGAAQVGPSGSQGWGGPAPRPT